MIKTKRLYKIVSMQRSGQHGIMNWIMKSFDNSYVLYNDSQIHKGQIVPGNASLNLKKTDVQCLVCNLEDGSIDMFGSFINTPVKNVQHKTEYRIIIMRDPFNLWASRTKYFLTPGMHKGGERLMTNKFVHRWIGHAKEVLGETSKIPNLIYVNYNKWLVDKVYRKEITNLLDMPFNDKGLLEIPHVGTSSFDRSSYHGRANKMKLMDRWQTYKNDEVYKKMIVKPEIMDLSEKLFQFNPFKRTK